MIANVKTIVSAKKKKINYSRFCFIGILDFLTTKIFNSKNNHRIEKLKKPKDAQISCPSSVKVSIKSSVN